MATVLVAPVARDRLDEIIATHSLPVGARDRVRDSLAVLERFPLAGQQLSGRWLGFRRLLGPWRWMQLIYHYDPIADVVGVVTIEDVRRSTAARLR